MVTRLIPNGERGHIDHNSLGDRFSGAADNVRKIKRVDLSGMGFDWNGSIFTPSGKKIEYSVGNVYSDRQEPVRGNIGNVGRGQIGISVYNPGLIGVGSFGNDEIIRTLAEAVGYTSKLDILDDTVFLSKGRIERDVLEDGGVAKEGLGKRQLGVDVERYRNFTKDLSSRANRIIIGQCGDSFGNYKVFQMSSGFYVAQSPLYGDATYVVTDLDVLLQDKQSIREGKDAIIIVRDNRRAWERDVLNIAA